MPDIFDEVAKHPAAKAPDPSLWKDKAKDLITRNKLNGKVERWKLDGGKPVFVSEEKK